MRYSGRSKITIRSAHLRDLDQLVRVEKASWEAACDPSDMYTEETFRGHIDRAPDLFCVAERSGRVVGYVSALRLGIPLGEADDRITTWYAATGDGSYSTHNPDGESIFGASLAVVPEAGNQGVGIRLKERLCVRCIELGLPGILLGGRLPGMANYLSSHPGATPAEYFRVRRPDGKAYDSELRFYERDLVEVRKLLPEYFSDSQSCNYGVLLVWRNPFYGKLPKPVAVLVFRFAWFLSHLKRK